MFQTNTTMQYILKQKISPKTPTQYKQSLKDKICNRIPVHETSDMINILCHLCVTKDVI